MPAMTASSQSRAWLKAAVWAMMAMWPAWALCSIGECSVSSELVADSAHRVAAATLAVSEGRPADAVALRSEES